jgi:hypothetical protein
MDLADELLDKIEQAHARDGAEPSVLTGRQPAAAPPLPDTAPEAAPAASAAAATVPAEPAVAAAAADAPQAEAEASGATAPKLERKPRPVSWILAPQAEAGGAAKRGRLARPARSPAQLAWIQAGGATGEPQGSEGSGADQAEADRPKLELVQDPEDPQNRSRKAAE